MRRALVTGAGGFIGSHLVTYLKQQGYFVRGVDIKRPEFGDTTADEFLIRDLRFPLPAMDAMAGGFDEVYALAADMGGMGFISYHDAEIMHNNSLINLNTLEAARHAKVERYLFTSSACVYPGFKQEQTDVIPLAEADAYPAWPDTEYGWEKLYTERMCLAYGKAYGFEVRIPRFHNIYGPLGSFDGGREKVPAALCRKVAEAKIAALRDGWQFTRLDDGSIMPIHATAPNTPLPEIEVWGDGEQTRSFLYIEDCVEAVFRLMHSRHKEPLNIGSDRAISINELAYLVMRKAGVKMAIDHIRGPEGVRGRNSDNTLCAQVLDWRPFRSLDGGMALTYAWVESQVQGVS